MGSPPAAMEVLRVNSVWGSTATQNGFILLSLAYKVKQGLGFPI